MSVYVHISKCTYQLFKNIVGHISGGITNSERRWVWKNERRFTDS